ncbi:hypothetical protein JD844_032604 [Phrynosoma platyrhinos]|uniref:Phospholipid/glycerol acyltransferase domain-containing protein n=1 Tax=Phrynosoma platyrhinos TaxID=52577 RepID=A0ABQ7T4X0_PHRPL|nr:hypothetical protein JD844_032604 [Phrynosoma platyrhinos]
MGLIAFLKTQFIVHLLIGFVFVVSGFIINFIQLCTLILWPINKQFYRRVNCRLSYSLWSQLVMLLEWWSGTECTLFSDHDTVAKFGKEHVIIILNHNFEIDFLCGWTMTERFGVLGSSKVLAKKELLYVPLIGWTWYFLEIVFCKRKWEEDRDTVIEGLKRLSDYPEYMWQSEHRNNEAIILLTTVSAVYDVTLNFRGNKNPSLLGILYGKKYEADMCVRSYLSKDALQEKYNQEGIFPGKQFKPPRRPWTLLNFLFWATILLSPLFKFGFGIFASGSPLLILAFLGFVGAASFGVRRLIGVTEIEKGSSYGNQEFKKKK